jgi:phosphatidylinositol 4-kinase type 2
MSSADGINNRHRDRAISDASSSIDLRIFIKDVQDVNGRKRPLTVRPWATIKDVKDQLTRHLHIPASSQCIYFGPVLSSAKELPNHRSLQDAGIYRNGETLLLEIKGNSPGGIHPGGLLMKSSCPSISSLRNQTNDICVSSSTLDLAPKGLQRLVQQARRGLALGFKPYLAPDGSGGSYFLSDARKKRVGVFKPADEEPFAENNPRGYVPHHHGASSSSSSDPLGGDGGGECLRQGIRPGELCLREVAAFLLDHDGFSGVPMTTLAEARHPALHVAGTRWTLSEGGAGVGVHSLTHSLRSASMTGTLTSIPTSSPQELAKKVGSFQEYVHAECTMDDISPSKVSVDEVHKIAILDIRIMNADRNVANILCQRIPEDPDRFRLIPIDHGYSLRSKCDVAWFDWCWLDWPQMKQPLSKASRDYVLGLDIEADVRMLNERLNMQNDVLDYFRSSCLILKAGVRAGLTLYDICSAILCRNDPGGEFRFCD